MSASPVYLSGVILLHSGQVIYADMHAARLLGVGLDALSRATQEHVLERFDPAARERLQAALATAESGEMPPILDSVCLEADGGTGCMDALVDQTLHRGRAVLRMVLFDRSAAQVAGERLRQHVQRLQILHEIDQAILSVQDETATAGAALQRIGAFVPHFIAGSVVLIDRLEAEAPETTVEATFAGPARLLAFYPPENAGDLVGRAFKPEELAVDLRALADGMPFIVHDLDALALRLPLQEQMAQAGIRSYLAVPLRWSGRLMGILNLAAGQAGVFGADHVQIAQEVADSLAVALQQARLRRDERRRQQETAVMRDVMAALASAGNLRQTLEALLVNLHNLIVYDRAGLFLVDENEQMVRADRGLPGSESGTNVYLDNHPLVVEMRRARQPVVVADIQDDERFAGWPDVDSVRGWLGAPLLAGDRLLGFISLGALDPDAYSPADQETMRMFAAEVSQVLERAWQDEQSQQRSAELEVLTNITFALGRVEGGSDTLAAILTQVAQFFGASGGALLVHDPGRNALVVKASLDPALLEATHPFGEDSLWETVSGGQLQVIADVDETLRSGGPPLVQALFDSGSSAAILPLSSFGSTFGLLCLVFENRRRFSTQTLNLFNAVAEIAGASLRRAVVLEGLEKQVTIRTQHLSTLYRINAAAGEPLPLEGLLDRVLDTTVEALKGKAACVHLLDEAENCLFLAAQRGLVASALPVLETIPLGSAFWADLLGSPDPVVIPDLAAEADAPSGLVEAGAQHSPAFIGAPIRAKGEALGTLSLFGETILNYTIEDITLFTTIADQIGGLVERARLVRQAELAAVVQERQRLARELHDSVTQLLYSQILFSGAGLKELRRGNQPLAESHLARIEAAAQQALKEMRLLVYELRPSNELDEGLAAALERRLEAVERRTGMVARLIVNGEAVLDQPTSMALYRIAEEALNNTLKHAGAATVLVALRFEDHAVSLEIADDGRGFDARLRPPGGMGLANMRDRTAQLGGEFVLDSALGEGTRVSVKVELNNLENKP